MRNARLVAVLLLAGCATIGTWNFDSAAGATSVAIQTTANRVLAACGNTEPDGPCQAPPVGQIDSDAKQRMKYELQKAQDAYALAVDAYIAGNVGGAQSGLEAASHILDAIEAELIRAGVAK